MEAFEECGVDPHGYVSRERSPDEGLPWDHISAGVAKEFLWRERLRSREEKLSPGLPRGRKVRRVRRPRLPGLRGMFSSLSGRGAPRA